MDLDRAKGCLVGGAVGDALGYPVEFLSEKEIARRYGSGGIEELESDAKKGMALISDDTQMTLFTANGLLLAAAHPGERSVEGWIFAAYLDWLETQYASELAERRSWLLDVPELYALRAPGGTCLSALRGGKMGSVKEPVNNSKGCGGIMRVAPVAVHGHAMGWSVERSARVGAEAAAITHGHPLGWLSSAALVGIVYAVLDGADVSGAVGGATDVLRRCWPGNRFLPEIIEGMERALELAGNEASDASNIARLGEGWVGEEALYIGIYCAARYEDDFDRALCVSVNHRGDSDSTGAVTGNILGARVGYEAIGIKGKEKLELLNVILEMTGDLCAPPERRDVRWMKKYAK